MASMAGSQALSEGLPHWSVPTAFPHVTNYVRCAVLCELPPVLLRCCWLAPRQGALILTGSPRGRRGRTFGVATGVVPSSGP